VCWGAESDEMVVIDVRDGLPHLFMEMSSTAESKTRSTVVSYNGR